MSSSSKTPIKPLLVPSLYQKYTQTLKLNTQKDANKHGNPGTSKDQNKCKRARKPQVAKGKGNNSKSNKDKSITCTKYGCYNHLTQKHCTQKHLVKLYLNSVRRGRSN